MMDVDVHRVEKVVVEDTHQLEKGGSYCRNIVVRNEDEKAKISLFADEEEELEFKEE